MKKGKGFSKLITVVIIASIGVAAYMNWSKILLFWQMNICKKSTENVTVTESADTDVIVQPKVPYKVTVNFGTELLDQAQREKKLIILTQKGSVSYQAEKSGLFNLPVFSQTKLIIFHGKGTYTVDLAGFAEKNILVDNDKKTVEIHIPEPVLEVEYLPEETEFFEANNGLLRFGQMELTLEATAEIETLGKEKLKAAMEADTDSMATAEKYAALSVKDIFQPLVNQMVDAAVTDANDEYAEPVYYTVDVVIDKE